MIHHLSPKYETDLLFPDLNFRCDQRKTLKAKTETASHVIIQCLLLDVLLDLMLFTVAEENRCQN